MSRYRKALAAGVSTFLGAFPVVSFIGDESMSDPKGVATAAALAALAAFFTALAPKNAD